MPRARAQLITESETTLRSLERRADDRTRVKIRCLRLLKKHPTRTLAAIATELGVPIATLERWWARYRELGLSGYLADGRRGGNRRSKLSDEASAAVAALLASGALTTASDVQSWILQEHGIVYSASGARDLTRRFAPPKSDSRQPSTASARNNTLETSPAPALDVSPLLALLSSLPLSCSVVESVQELRQALRAMLPDVDRISIDVNTSVDLDTPEDYEPDLLLTQTVLPNGAPPAVRLEAAGTPGAMAAHLVEGFRAGGVSLDIYHPPLWREYYLADNAYLGTVLLWRERVRRPLTGETAATLDSLHRFMLFILSDIVARHHYANPLDRVFYDVVRSLSDECGLGRQERRVLVRRLLGESFKTIADQMNIAPNTVGQYVSAIYRKTGTRSAVELFAKYFTPRLTSIDVSLISNR